ncbi:uncharacterized protein CANTADRAFT_5771 [Suhomyces tanzawaensis NRRL Y-17324]|uniref:Spindle pole body component n=1 Tax=Suhomyces tanzawaensis NRRL Y-17324 TaxID=984487 RepID=A0A1E4SKR8_9ASCO|nr:uncharacterized protein CANTADRAFT_5771 [Suhomyces tanzawaensis NRRL Y-17324]ODV80101.1 hypothetical protein CANTADRAFT_5771 [Suhomyces tanzawaensis NRRL Y-17324]
MNSIISSIDPGESHTVVLSDHPSLIRSCINNNTKRPNRIRPYPLSDVNDLKIQQGLIIKDLLFACLGFEGCYIRYSERYDGTNNDSKVRGPDFKIAKHLDISLKSITKKLIRFGKFYSGLKGFVEIYDHNQYGTVIQNLCNQITQFLKAFQAIIISIEQEFKFNATFNLNLFESMINQVVDQITHLYEISIQIHDLTVERQTAPKTSQFQDFLSNVTTSLKKSGIVDINVNGERFDSCKGGLVLRIIQQRINVYKGDFKSSEFLTSLFESVSKDYLVMLNEWLINGDINDTADEFLIREKQVPPRFLEIINSKSEHYWNELFIIRTDGLIDQFSSIEIQRKILNTGKYLNIFRACTGITNFQSLHESILPIDKIISKDLELKINEFYNRSNKLLMKLLFEGFGLRNVIRDYQSLFLFDDSYKIDKFLDKTFYDLKRNRYAVSLSKVQKQYRDISCSVKNNSSHTNSLHEFLLNSQVFSVTTTNFYQVAKEIMNVQSFDEQIFQQSNFQNIFQNINPQATAQPSSQDNQSNFDQNHSDEYAISSVDLTINLPFPLNLIINRELSYHYELMFKLQIMIKFLDKFNIITWQNINQSSVWKYSGFEPRIKKWILRCRILHKRILDFLNELQSYLNYEVIDSNYKKLSGYFEKVDIQLSNSELGSVITSTDSRAIHGNPSLNNYNNNNANLFESKILSHENKRKNFYNQETHNHVSIEDLMNNLNGYLNALINDSLITKEELLDNLKHFFDLIILYNHYLNRLKKILILCNEQLFERFASDFPDKFTEKSVDPKSIDVRFENLNGSLKDYYDNFGDSLTQFIVGLRRYGEVENKLILALSERLERCFPES